MLPRVVPPESGIQHLEENCKMNINLKDEGVGTLYISEERLIWANSESRGLSLGYKDIAIHAISRDLQAFPEECLYVMFNGEVGDSSDAAMNGNGHQSEEDGSDDYGEDSNPPTTEIRFIPPSSESLQKMYDAMSDCQCLHPDSEDSDDYYEGGEGDGSLEEQYEGADYPPFVYDDSGAAEGFYTSEEGFNHLTPAGQATLARLENMLSQSQTVEPEEICPQMEGVIIEDDVKPIPDKPPVIGRAQTLNDHDSAKTEMLIKQSVEGQFDDAE